MNVERAESNIELLTNKELDEKIREVRTGIKYSSIVVGLSIGVATAAGVELANYDTTIGIVGIVGGVSGATIGLKGLFENAAEYSAFLSKKITKKTS